MPDISLDSQAGELPVRLGDVLAEVAEDAASLDREPRFPHEALARLAECGATAYTVPAADGSRPSIADEWQLVRRVAAASGSVGRIFDGHLNAVERIATAAPPDVRQRELAAVSAGERLLGVWGADPGPGEGAPAVLSQTDRGWELNGAKTFCSGAGGVDAALIMVRGEEPGPPYLVLVEMDETAEIDRSWFRSGGLRASESHRVVFDHTPVAALIGERGELGREPWFSRDALRTAASWAGMIDAAAEDAIADLAARRRGEDLSRLAAGRISAALGTVDVWFAAAAAAVNANEPLRGLSIRLRSEVVAASRTILDEASRACGSRPFALGSALDRARRDLEIFTLQHRLDPMLIAEGAKLLDPEAG